MYKYKVVSSSFKVGKGREGKGMGRGKAFTHSMPSDKLPCFPSPGLLPQT